MRAAHNVQTRHVHPMSVFVCRVNSRFVDAGLVKVVFELRDGAALEVVASPIASLFSACTVGEDNNFRFFGAGCSS